MYHRMKRTLLFLLLMMGFLSPALAQSAELAEGFYRIISRRTGLSVTVNNRQLGYPAENHNEATGNSQADLNRFWYVKRVNGELWIINVGHGLPVQDHGQLNVTFQVGRHPASYYIKPASGAGSENYWVVSTTPNFSGNSVWHNGGSGLVQNWNGLASASNHWQFVPLTAEEKKAVSKFEQQWPLTQQEILSFAQFRKGGVYRIQGKSQRYWTEHATSHVVTTTAQLSNDDYSTLWVIEPNGEGFTFRNAATGRAMPAPTNNTAVATVTDKTALYLKITDLTTQHFMISAANSFGDGTCMVENAQNALVGGNSTVNATTNTAAEWKLLPAENISLDKLKENYAQNSGAVYTPQEGKYYVVHNLNYAGQVLSLDYGLSNTLSAAVRRTSELGQLWQFKKVGNGWALFNVVSGRYIGNNASRNGAYPMQDSPAPFTLKSMDSFLPKLAFEAPNRLAIHAQGRTYLAIAWDATSPASHWQLEEVALDAAALENYRNQRGTFQQLKANRQTYTDQLQNYFEDFACTQLKAPYKAMSWADLQTQLKTLQLPQSLIDMVHHVHAQQWIAPLSGESAARNAQANEYAKRFRIQDYQAYSHPQKWASDNQLMRTAFGQYSQITNPTGVTIPANEFVNVFVNEDAPANCELKAEIVTGKNKTGSLYTLQKGLNTIYTEQEAHLYINYVMNNVDMKFTEQPKIRIHVEGGRVNGYHDSQTHSNQDWDNLRALKKFGFFNDEVIRLKSKHTIHSISLKGVEDQQDRGNWTYNNEYKGINGVLGKWDWTNEMEQDFLSPEQFAGRFNCLLFNTDASGLYATNYGTFLGTVSTTFSYKEWARGASADNGGNVWAVVHETGHHYQQLFNLARCVESSNNLWSNMALWKRGSNVSRGQPLQTLIDRYNNGDSWIDMGLGDRMRMYWQLWLYYVELGHKPNFYRDLFAKFRNNPINFSNAKTDFLLFAKLASDAAQEDLTEFFTFYGFFKKTGANLPLKYNDTFYDNYYPPGSITVAKEDVDECLAYMKKYSKKPNNILFIDERIRKTPATYEGAKPGEMRLATDPGREPGDAKVFGDVGHYTDFGVVGKDGQVIQPPTVAQPRAVTLEGRVVRIDALGAVGYKVLDAQGNMVMLSNQNMFVIPEKYDLSQLTVVVGGGDGGTVEVIKAGAVVPDYDHPITPPANTTDLAVSTSTKHPAGKYIIRNFRPYDKVYYYADQQTRPVNERDKAGQFLWVAGGHSGEFYLYSLGLQKWAKVDNLSNTPNKMQWVDDLSQAQKWSLEKVHTNGSAYYNVSPTQNKNTGWNWHGGFGNANNTFGFWSVNDGNSHWQFLPADVATEYHALVMHADSLTKQDEPKVKLARRQLEAFQQFIEAGKNRTDAAEADLIALKEEIARWKAWTKADRLLQTPPFGKPEYTQFRVPFKEFLDNTPLATTTAAQINEYNKYFQLLLSVDSLLSIQNPGYALAKVVEASHIENTVILPAAHESQPNLTKWEGRLQSISTIIADAARNRKAYPQDADAYYMPEDGKVYRLRSYYDGRFVTNKEAASSKDNGKKVPVSLSRTEDNTTLWVLQQDKAGNQYLASASGAGYLARMPQVNHGTLVNAPAKLNIGTARRVLGDYQKYGTLYIRNEGLSLVAWKDDDAIGGHPGTEANPVWHGDNGIAGTSFFFDTVTDATFSVTLNPAKNGNYATTHLPFAVILPEGLRAYAAKEVTKKSPGAGSYDQEVALVPIEGKVIPANTAVILSSNRPGTYELRPTQWQAPIATKLSGANLPLTASERNKGTDYYALTIDDETNEYLFRKVNPKVDIPGNRAYFILPSSGTSNAPKLRVSMPMPTGLSPAPQTSQQPQAIFNLAGQRIDAKTAKGVVISKGQKIIIR